MTWNKPLVYLECRRNILWSFLFFLSRVINEGCKAHICWIWKKSDNKKTFKCLKHLKCLRIPHLRCILRNTCNVDFVHLREAIIPKIFDEVRLHFDFVKLSNSIFFLWKNDIFYYEILTFMIRSRQWWSMSGMVEAR